MGAGLQITMSSTDLKGADKFHLIMREIGKGATSGGGGCVWPSLKLTYHVSMVGEAMRKFCIE